MTKASQPTLTGFAMAWFTELEGFQARTRRVEFGPCARLAHVILLLFVTALPSAAQPNIVFILVDDLGIEHLEFYGAQDEEEEARYAYTPELSGLQPAFVRFTNAWSNPVCSPTRMTVQTGLYGFVTGIGTTVKSADPFQPVLTESWMLAEMLRSQAGYDTGVFGKWHLGTEDDAGFDDAPETAGYNDAHVVLLKHNGGPPNYFSYYKTYNNDTNLETPLTEYLTKATADWAIEWIEEAAQSPSPWFAYVAFNAPHDPFMCPPAAEYEGKDFRCDDPPPAEPIDVYQDMITALDHDIERILDRIGELAPQNTVVIIASDNGSPGVNTRNIPPVTLPPVMPMSAKGSVFQGGVRVPLLIGGPEPYVDNTVGEVDHGVNLSDLYDTILDLAGLPPDPVPDRPAWQDLHSRSLRPYLVGETPEEERECVYTEIFLENGDPSGGFWAQAVAGVSGGALYKALTSDLYGIRLYNLTPDPWEKCDILNGIEGDPECNEDDGAQDILAGLVTCLTTMTEP